MTILDQIRIASDVLPREAEKPKKEQAAVEAELLALARNPFLVDGKAPPLSGGSLDQADERQPHPFLQGRDVHGRLLKGYSGNLGGGSGLRKAFVDRLKQEDADVIYRVFMTLVCERNVPAVLKAVEYIAGKPKESIDVNLTHRPAELDLGKLSTEELENLERLVARAQGTVTE